MPKQTTFKMQSCVICNEPVDPKYITFEQRLVEDKHFCSRCWNEIMQNDDEASLTYLDAVTIGSKPKTSPTLIK